VSFNELEMASFAISSSVDLELRKRALGGDVLSHEPLCVLTRVLILFDESTLNHCQISWRSVERILIRQSRP
jgi:hypothetical protein